MNHLIVDGSNLLHRSLHVPSIQWLRDSKGRGTGGVMSFLKTMHYALEQFSVSGKCVCVWDTGRSQRRMKMFKEYKGNRSTFKGIPNDQYTVESVLEGIKLIPDAEGEFPFAQEYLCQRFRTILGLDLLNTRSLWLRGREGDDLIFQTIRYLTTTPGEHITIMSEDKDMLQLIDPHVDVWRPIEGKLWTLEVFRDFYGFDPKFYVFFKAITGDSSDNIPGVKGAGPKTAINVCTRMREPTVEGLQRALAASDLPFREKKVRDGMVTVFRNLKLMDLKLETFDGPWDEAMYEVVLNTDLGPVDTKAFLRFCNEYDLQSIKEMVMAWLNPFRRLT